MRMTVIWIVLLFGTVPAVMAATNSSTIGTTGSATTAANVGNASPSSTMPSIGGGNSVAGGTSSMGVGNAAGVGNGYYATGPGNSNVSGSGYSASGHEVYSGPTDVGTPSSAGAASNGTIDVNVSPTVIPVPDSSSGSDTASSDSTQ